jgi:hypothetical protein
MKPKTNTDPLEKGTLSKGDIVILDDNELSINAYIEEYGIEKLIDTSKTAGKGSSKEGTNLDLSINRTNHREHSLSNCDGSPSATSGNKELRELEREIRELKASRRKLAECHVCEDDDIPNPDGSDGWVGITKEHNPKGYPHEWGYVRFDTKEEAIQSWIDWSEEE